MVSYWTSVIKPWYCTVQCTFNDCHTALETEAHNVVISEFSVQYYRNFHLTLLQQLNSGRTVVATDICRYGCNWSVWLVCQDCWHTSCHFERNPKFQHRECQLLFNSITHHNSTKDTITVYLRAQLVRVQVANKSPMPGYFLQVMPI